ncbi:glycosyltransferase [Longitalea luteola]|uniref:glycosyltransferase n=1 Tax=Longitalea luteola TaxID=2812563 RepID=UPI001A95AAD7|nr:glycosyltransferase [Longitalea luteola]
MQQVLLITDINFWVKGAGHRMRIYNLVDYLVHHVQLTILYLGADDPARRSVLHGKIAEVCFLPVEIIATATMEQTGLYVSALLKDRNFDAIIVEYIHNTYLLNYIDLDNAITILDAHDLISERTKAFKKYNYQSLFEMSEEFEFQVFDIYDHVIVLCGADQEKINSFFDYPKALLCSHSTSVSYHDTRPTVSNLAFIASEYDPNIDAIHFFIENCWPAVQEKYNVTLSVYGNVCRKIRAAGKGIILNGFVADLQEIYKNVDIVINPVRFGAGLKIKNIEALANGKPLVTSAHGARGLEMADGKAFLTANEPAHILDALSLLIENTDRRLELSRNAYDFIRKYFSAETAFAPLLEVINNAE